MSLPKKSYITHHSIVASWVVMKVIKQKREIKINQNRVRYLRRVRDVSLEGIPMNFGLRT